MSVAVHTDRPIAVWEVVVICGFCRDGQHREDTA